LALKLLLSVAEKVPFAKSIDQGKVGESELVRKRNTFCTDFINLIFFVSTSYFPQQKCQEKATN
jgi:hypothetical protein